MLRLASRKTRASSTAGNTPTSSLGKYPWADMQRLKKPRDHLGERKNCLSVKSNAFQLIGLRRVDVGGQAFKRKRVDTPKQEPARNDSKNPQYRDRAERRLCALLWETADLARPSSAAWAAKAHELFAPMIAT
jgi:hypothetical protein